MLPISDCRRNPIKHTSWGFWVWPVPVSGKPSENLVLGAQNIIGGHLPKRAFALAIEWASEYRAELLENWNLCQSKQAPKRIAPLE
jgi:hypothetical protein